MFCHHRDADYKSLGCEQEISGLRKQLFEEIDETGLQFQPTHITTSEEGGVMVTAREGIGGMVFSFQDRTSGTLFEVMYLGTLPITRDTIYWVSFLVKRPGGIEERHWGYARLKGLQRIIDNDTLQMYAGGSIKNFTLKAFPELREFRKSFNVEEPVQEIVNKLMDKGVIDKLQECYLIVSTSDNGITLDVIPEAPWDVAYPMDRISGSSRTTTVKLPYGNFACLGVDIAENVYWLVEVGEEVVGNQLPGDIGILTTKRGFPTLYSSTELAIVDRDYPHLSFNAVYNRALCRCDD